MNVIKEQIGEELKLALQEVYENYKDQFDVNHNKISSITLMDKWGAGENFRYLLELLKQDSEYFREFIENKNHEMVYFRLMNAPPDCDNQYFHLDYNGCTTSFIIPFMDLTDLNGTEYVHFNDESNYSKHFKLMEDINLAHCDNIKTEEKLKEFNLINGEDYVFKIVNSKANALVRLPNFALHRGQKNKTSVNRTVLVIINSINQEFNFSQTTVTLDEEIDDEIPEHREKVLEYRRNNGFIV